MKTSMKGLLGLDFETKAIGRRPLAYPPFPVGYAWELNGKRGYESWGHPEGNNTTFIQAAVKLKRLQDEATRAVCHNSIFDVEVNDEHMNALLKIPVHDTMLLAFLHDPYGPLSLKPLAEKLLGEPPLEQDRLHDWILAHCPGATKKTAGAYISDAPVHLVKPYAIGDVTRTMALYKQLDEHLTSEAYLRELELRPVVMDMEKQGVRINRKRLEHDLEVSFRQLDTLDQRIRRKLGDVDLDEDVLVTRALKDKGKLSKPLPVTDAGNVQANKNALIDCVKDKQLLGDMLLRNALATCIRNFMQNWLEEADGNIMHFRFSATRSEGGVGARTGRMSSSPNLMNIPSTWEFLYAVFKKIGYKPEFTLPNMREYIMPDDAEEVLIGADYSQQEMRIFAHYEDGPLMHAYQENPDIDAHDMVATLANISRKTAKTLNFAALYGAGIPVIMQWLGCSDQEARAFRAQYNAALPGVKALQRQIDAAANRGEPITTIGGRQYYPEPPKHVKGVLRVFNYKLLNYLVQGSAADQTKQAMADYWNYPNRKGKLKFPVHDQLVVSVHKRHAAKEMLLLQDFMAKALAEDFDVTFRTDAKIGKTYAEI